MVAAPAVHLVNRVLGRQQLKNLPIHVLTGPGGLEAHISPLGGVIQRLIVPDREGNLEDIVLGFDDIEPYAVSSLNERGYEHSSPAPQLSSHTLLMPALQKSRYEPLYAVLQDGRSPYFGAVVGRVANRIANAEFTLKGTTYKLAANNPPNALHGGKRGFDKVVWEGDCIVHPEGDAVRLQYISRNGEEVGSLILSENVQGRVHNMPMQSSVR